MSQQPIKPLAEAHCKSFVAVAQGSYASTTDRAAAYSAFFAPTNFVAFSPSPSGAMVFPDPTHMTTQLTKWLDALVKFDIGFDIRLEALRVEELSPSAALCWITQSLNPPAESGVPRLEVRNFYSYRLVPGQERGYFEFVVNDSEVFELSAKVPGFFESLAGAEGS